jgi:hypothetical protein
MGIRPRVSHLRARWERHSQLCRSLHPPGEKGLVRGWLGQQGWRSSTTNGKLFENLKPFPFNYGYHNRYQQYNNANAYHEAK